MLPFLLGDRFAGRVDLKAERKTSTLLVQASYAEAGNDPDTVAEALAGELRHMAQWIGLEHIIVAAKGDLAARTARSICWVRADEGAPNGPDVSAFDGATNQRISPH